jgi:putative DNA primase/helicase
MGAESIANALGSAYRSGEWWRCHCPVHASRGSTLTLRDGERGLIVYCHAGCSRVDILAELRRRGLLDGHAGVSAPLDPAEMDRRRNAEVRERRRRTAIALDVWGECHPAPGTIVERYWRSRGLVEPIPPSLRMHGMLHHRDSGGSRPAMVGLVEHVEHGPVGVHITYLAVDGSMKASLEPGKRSLGPVGGGAVRLAPAGETLLVAEGIETAASGMQSTAIPTWAALSKSGLKALVLPPIVRNVIILADNDLSGAGQEAALTTGYRWLAEGRQVLIAIPPEPRTDFNDVLRGQTHAQIAEARDVAA